jgi:hypothetical protein
MKITEVRKIYNKEPQTLFGAIMPDKVGYVSTDDLEAKRVPKSYSIRVKIVSLQKYYYNYWDLGRRVFADLATARTSLTPTSDSEKSFAYLCEVFDDNGQSTGFRLLSSRSTFIGEITPELEHYWANESVYRAKVEAEMERRQQIVVSANRQAEKRAGEAEKAIRNSTKQILIEAGLKEPTFTTYFRSGIKNDNWRDVNVPFSESDVEPQITGKIEFDYVEFQRLLEIVYEAKAKL